MDAYFQLNNSQNRILLPREFNLLINRLHEIGFIQTSAKPTSFDAAITFTLRYDQNVNGGNRYREIDVNGINFTTTEDQLSQEDLLFGIRHSATLKHFYGYGKYLQFDSDLRKERAMKDHTEISSFAFSSCSKNNIENWDFIDVCYSTSNTHKQLSNLSSDILSINFLRYSGTNPGRATRSTFELKALDVFSEPQMLIGTSLYEIWGAKHFHLSGHIGKKIHVSRAPKVILAAKVDGLLTNRKLSLASSYTEYHPSTLFGHSLNESIRTLSVQYKLSPKIQIEFSLNKLKSNIHSLNFLQPSFSINFGLF